MRGRAAATSRSKNSYITSRRRVTRQPMGWPWRSLKLAMLFRDLLMTALRPVINARSFAASSTAVFSSDALTPIFTTIFSSRGISWRFRYCRFSFKADLTSLRYFSCNLGFIIAARRTTPDDLFFAQYSDRFSTALNFDLTPSTLLSRHASLTGRRTLRQPSHWKYEECLRAR